MKRFAFGTVGGIVLGVFAWCTGAVLLSSPSYSVAQSAATPVLVLENEKVKAWSLTLEPSQSTTQHTHDVDEIVICLEGSTLRITKLGQEPEEHTVSPKTGDILTPQVKDVTHTLTNTGKTRYKQISLELK